MQHLQADPGFQVQVADFLGTWRRGPSSSYPRHHHRPAPSVEQRQTQQEPPSDDLAHQLHALTTRLYAEAADYYPDYYREEQAALEARILRFLQRMRWAARGLVRLPASSPDYVRSYRRILG